MKSTGLKRQVVRRPEEQFLNLLKFGTNGKESTHRLIAKPQWNMNHNHLTKPHNKVSTFLGPISDYLADNQENLISSIIAGLTLKYAIYNLNNQLIVDDSVVLPFQGAQRILIPQFCNGVKNHVYILTKDQIVYEGALDKNGKMQFEATSNCQTNFLNMVPWNHLSKSKALGRSLIFNRRGIAFLQTRPLLRTLRCNINEPVIQNSF